MNSRWKNLKERAKKRLLEEPIPLAPGQLFYFNRNVTGHKNTTASDGTCPWPEIIFNTTPLMFISQRCVQNTEEFIRVEYLFMDKKYHTFLSCKELNFSLVWCIPAKQRYILHNNA